VNLDTWRKDFTHAARSLLRAPGFTLVVIVTLALAIGANAAIFSVVNPVLLSPLPFPHADRLVHIGGTAPGTDQPPEFGVPDELYFEYRETVPGIEDAGLYGYGSATTRAEGHVDQLQRTSGASISSSSTSGRSTHAEQIQKSRSPALTSSAGGRAPQKEQAGSPSVAFMNFLSAGRFRVLCDAITPVTRSRTDLRLESYHQCIPTKPVSR
jgi:hypothetical protein